MPPAAPRAPAKQNCLAWERSARHSERGDDRAGVGRPAIDRLAGDEHYGQLLRRWVADNCMRLNHVQVLGTHNSYHVEPRPALLQAIASFEPQVAASMEYTHRPLDELDTGVTRGVIQRLTELSETSQGSESLLSEREREILALVAHGYTNKEIAAKIFVSPYTARNHVIHILKKLGLSRRSEAAAQAVRLGLEGESHRD